MITKLKNVFMRNRMKKFIALVVATMLWLVVMSDQNPVIEGSYRVNLSVLNIPGEHRAIYDEQQIKVSLNAPRSYFINYSENDIRAFANLANYVEGEFDVPIEVSFPQGFELDSISPEKVHVKIDPIIEKQFPAEIIVNGSPDKSAVIKSIMPSTEFLTVVGPKSFVEKVNRVVGYVGVSGNKESFELQVPLTVINEDGREVKGVRAVPSAITVKVDIESGIQKKIVPIVAELTPPEGFEFGRVKVEPEILEIAGKEEILSQIISIKTVAVVVQNLPNNTYKAKLNLVIPDGIFCKTKEVAVTAELKKKTT